MKFNLQLKQQLVEYEKSLQSKPVPKNPDSIADPPPKPPPFFPLGAPFYRKEKVVGGDILWKPIDRIAAMLLRKAPWWAQPVYEKTQTETKTPKPHAPRDEKTKGNRETKRVLPSQGSKKAMKDHISDTTTQAVTNKSDHEMSTELASKFVKDTHSTVDKSNELLVKALDARAALDVMADRWKNSWMEFMTSSDERLRELRMTRIAFDTETRMLMASLREVRGFFLDKDYDTEIARLKDFVQTCERLKALKDSGFLDTVADTMLRLAENEKRL